MPLDRSTDPPASEEPTDPRLPVIGRPVRQLIGRPVRRLIGRDAPLARLRDLVSSGARLVTVTGPPGVGKTTLLSHWLAQQARDSSEWIVCGVSAGRFRDIHTLARAILCALGDEPRAQPLEQVGPALARAPTLLVMDELDDVAAAAGPQVEAWLVAAPELQIVTASRVRIGVPTEQLVELGALDHHDARELLAACVDDLQPAWSNESAALAELARRTGGLPLAIELAASRCRVLSPEAVLEPVAVRTDLFGAALRDAIERSVAALSASAARLYRRLSLFEGRFSVDSVADVLGDDLCLDDLQALRDASLVASADSSHLMLLPPIREDAYRRLLESAETDDLAPRHSAWVIDRGEAAVRALQRGDARAAFVALGRLQPEISAALARARRARAPDVLRLVPIMAEARGMHGSPHALWEDIDDIVTWDLDRAARGELAILGARLAYRRGEPGRAQELLDLARSLHPPLARAPGWSCEAAMVHILRGDPVAARAELERASGNLTPHSDRHGAARVHSTFVELYRTTGDFDQALRHGEIALRLLGSGAPMRRAAVLTGLAFVSAERGDAALCQTYAGEGLAVLDELSNDPGLTRTALHLALGRAFHLQGDLPAALHAYRMAERGPHSLMAMFARLPIGTLLAQQGLLVEARDQWLDVIDELETGYPVLWVPTAALLAAVEARLGQGGRARSRIDQIPEVERLPAVVRALVEDCRAVVEGSPEAPSGEPAPTLEGRLARCLREAHLRAEPVGGLRVRALRVAHDGTWLDASGTRVQLARRPVMRSLIVSLARARAGAPGKPLGHDELLAAGWGDQQMSRSSARRRVEVMISRIRALGVGDALETTAEGYRIHPDCQVVLDDGGPER